MVWGWVVGQDTQGCRRGRSLIQGGQLLLFVIHALFALGLGAADKQGCQRLQAPGELPWAWVRAVGGGAAVKGFSWARAGLLEGLRMACRPGGGGGGVRALPALGDAEPRAGDKGEGGLEVRVGVWWDLGMGEGMKFGQL